MISYSLLLLATFFLSMCVHGLQINIQSIKADNHVKDTVQEHFELIVDNVLGQHNEDLLSRLSTIIKDPQDMYATLKPQAELISDAVNIQDVCVAQMPGMIANQVHELSNAIYSSINQIVTQTWQFNDVQLRQSILSTISQGNDESDAIEDLSDTLDVVNMDMTDKVLNVIRDFDMVGKVRSSLVSCQSLFALEETDNTSFVDNIWAAITTATKSQNHPTHSFLDTFLLQLTTDLQVHLYNQVDSLAKSVYEDLAFSA